MELSFRGVEWETINDSFSERYMVLLEKQLWESEEYFEDDVRLESIEAEIRKTCNELGITYTTINQVHEETVDNRANNPLHSKLNDLIHHYERSEQSYPPRWGYRNGNSAIELQDSDYDLFTVDRKYGYLYVMYPHVARHFAEAVMSDDPHGTIEAQTLARPNFFCWLGSDMIVEDKFLSHAKKFIDKYDLSYDLTDKRLAVGYIPFARLKKDVPDLTTKLQWNN